MEAAKNLIYGAEFFAPAAVGSVVARVTKQFMSSIKGLKLKRECKKLKS